MNAVDLTGKVFGWYTVICKDGNNKHGHPMSRCLCRCGTVKRVANALLVAGTTKSCGCLAREQRKQFAKDATTHGLSKTRGYFCWLHMKERCTDPKHKEFHNYGGRGIYYCDAWKSFENFHRDMGDKPPGLSLERINNDGNYCPENCKWATPLEQGNNSRKNRRIEIDGETKTLSQWCRTVGINKGTVLSRERCGWGIVEAITSPIKIQTRAQA